VVGWMLCATFFVRTVTLRTVVSFWLLGFFGVVQIVRVVGAPIGAALGGVESALFHVVLVPLLEELAKMLPLALFLAVGSRNRSRQPGITELAILGFAVGAGFGFFENSIGTGVGASGWSGSFANLLFPTFVSGAGATIVVHSGWTAIEGLGLGAFWMLRSRRWSWILPAAALALATVDHARVNWVTRGNFFLNDLLGQGHIPVLVLFVGLVVAFLAEDRILQGSDGRERYFHRPGVADLRRAWGESGFSARVRRLLAVVVYLRSLNGAHYLMWQRQHGGAAAPARWLPRYLAVHTSRAAVPPKARRADDVAARPLAGPS